MLEQTIAATASPGFIERRNFERSLSGIGGARALRIGLLNNMPDSAFLQTERQFRRLIGPRADVKLFHFEHVARGEGVSGHIQRYYQPHSSVATTDIDALIITGCEPRASVLSDEAFFPAFADIVEWAKRNTISTLFSCLASHAAVLHLDAISRRPLGGKLSGVFDCQTMIQHPILTGMAGTSLVPHSRFNGLDEWELRQNGYQIARCGNAVGADMFLREEGSLFVFLQGHPEYDADSLAREYRRDVGRFLDGSRADYPKLPVGYYPAETRALFEAFQLRAIGERHPRLMASFPGFDIAPAPPPAWAASAEQLYRNWLSTVARRRTHNYAQFQSPDSRQRDVA